MAHTPRGDYSHRGWGMGTHGYSAAERLERLPISGYHRVIFIIIALAFFFDQVVVLVIRWYGGIQLGTGGLARAYGGGANKCLQTAERIELISRVPLSCDCGFSELNLVKLRVAELGGLVLEEHFTANGVELQLALGEAHIDTLQNQLADLSRGRILLQR